MPDLDLAAITARAEATKDAWVRVAQSELHDIEEWAAAATIVRRNLCQILTDIPALVTEVERLREALREAHQERREAAEAWERGHE